MHKQPGTAAGTEFPAVVSRLETLLREFFKQSSIFWPIIIEAYACLAYLLVNTILPASLPADMYMYFLQPLLWLALGGLALLGWHFGLEDHPAFKSPLPLMVVLMAFFQVAVLVLAGLVFGFGRSPYSHDLLSVIGNLYYLLSMLAGFELARAYFMVRFGRKHVLAALIVVTLSFAVLDIPLGKFVSMGSLPDSIKTIGQSILPNLVENLLSSLLALLGGPLASFIYRIILRGFEWLSPILPNLNWFIKAFIETLVPAFGLIFFYSHFLAQPTMEDTRSPEDRRSFIPWAVALTLSLALLGFTTGMFGVRPSLIASNSMSPNFVVGDIVITNEVPANSVQVGDVIEFRIGGVPVVHRVIDIENDGGQITFITQGDANNTPDPPVTLNNYEGKVLHKIPKIGWVSIFFRKIFAKIML
jgi:signal peptidase